MNSHPFPRRTLDDAIDRAVRDVVQHDPPPGIRRRVLGKLEAPPRRGLLPWLAVPAGTLAAVALVLVTLRSPAPPLDSPPQSPPVAEVAAAQPPVASGADAAPPAPAAPEASPAPPRRPTAGRAAGESIFGTPRGRVSATSVGALLADAPASEVEAHVQRVDAVPADAGAAAAIDVAPIAPPDPIVLTPIDIKEIASRPQGPQ